MSSALGIHPFLLLLTHCLHSEVAISFFFGPSTFRSLFASDKVRHVVSLHCVVGLPSLPASSVVLSWVLEPVSSSFGAALLPRLESSYSDLFIVQTSFFLNHIFTLLHFFWSETQKKKDQLLLTS